MDALPLEYPLRSRDTPLGSKVDARQYLGPWEPDMRRWHALLLKMQDQKFTGNITLAFLGGSFTSGRMYGLEDMTSEVLAYPSWHPEGYTNVNMSLPCRNSCNIVKRYKEPQYYQNYTSGDFGASIDCYGCAYPRRFQFYLEAAYPHLRGRIHAHNLGEPGTNSQSIFATLEDTLGNIGQPVDAFFIAYGDNDRNFFERDEGVVSAAFELLVRYLLHQRHHPVVINLEVYIIEIEKNDGICEYHRKVLRHYHLPTVNYDACATHLNYTELPDQQQNTMLRQNISGAGKNSSERIGFQIRQRHPAWPSHQMLSDFLAFVWSDQAASMAVGLGNSSAHGMRHGPAHSYGPMPEYDDARNILVRCLHPLSLVRAQPIVSNRPSYLPPAERSSDYRAHVSADHAWQYGEDVQGNGKPGWFIDSPRGGERIVFHLDAFTDTSWPLTVGVGYLSSYGTDMGRVAVRIFRDNPMAHAHLERNATDGISLRPSRSHSNTSLSSRRDSYPGVVIDSREASGAGAKNVSMSAFTVLCDRTLNTPHASTAVSDYRTQSNDTDGAFILASCKDMAGASRARRKQRVDGNLKIYVSITLLPALDSVATRNRFKILYVSSC